MFWLTRFQIVSIPVELWATFEGSFLSPFWGAKLIFLNIVESAVKSWIKWSLLSSWYSWTFFSDWVLVELLLVKTSHTSQIPVIQLVIQQLEIASLQWLLYPQVGIAQSMEIIKLDHPFGWCLFVCLFKQPIIMGSSPRNKWTLQADFLLGVVCWWILELKSFWLLYVMNSKDELPFWVISFDDTF